MGSLLFTIAIVALLSFIKVPSSTSSSSKARRRRRKSKVKLPRAITKAMGKSR